MSSKNKSTLRKIANLFTQEDIDTLIKRQEDKMIEEKIKMEEMNDQYQSACNVVKRYKNLEETHEKEKLLLEKLVQYKTGKIPAVGEKTKVYTKLSNVKQKDKNLDKFPMIAKAVELVKHEKRAFPTKELVKLLGSKFTNFQAYLDANNQHKHSAALSISRTKKLVVYNNKVGLPEWFAENGQPKSNYLTLFMN